MKKVKTFKSIEEVRNFVLKLRKEFNLTNFDAFLSLTRDIPEFEYHVNLEMLDAFSSGRESRQRLYIENLEHERCTHDFSILEMDYIIKPCGSCRR